MWLLDRFGHGDVCVSGSTIERTRVQALDLARVIYGRPLDADALVHARRLRHSPRALARLGCPFFPQPSLPTRPPAEQILVAYLTDGGGGRRPDARRAELRAGRGRAPGDHGRDQPVEQPQHRRPGDVAEHPLFKMAPLVPGGAEPALLATVNTDDPLTFATSLSDEFAHLAFALERKGKGGTVALDFLERVRAQALRARFTLPGVTSGLAGYFFQRHRRYPGTHLVARTQNPAMPYRASVRAAVGAPWPPFLPVRRAAPH